MVGRHALRNGLIVVVTILGVQVGYLLGGAVVVEEIFSLPGLGRMLLNAINQRDYALVQGAVLVVATCSWPPTRWSTCSMAVLDPRIRFSAEAAPAAARVDAPVAARRRKPRSPRAALVRNRAALAGS